MGKVCTEPLGNAGEMGLDVVVHAFHRSPGGADAIEDVDAAAVAQLAADDGAGRGTRRGQGVELLEPAELQIDVDPAV